MNDLLKLKATLQVFGKVAQKTKGVVIGRLLPLLHLLAITYFSTRVTMAQLFPEMSQAEVGRIASSCFTGCEI